MHYLSFDGQGIIDTLQAKLQFLGQVVYYYAAYLWGFLTYGLKIPAETWMVCAIVLEIVLVAFVFYIVLSKMRGVPYTGAWEVENTGVEEKTFDDIPTVEEYKYQLL